MEKYRQGDVVTGRVTGIENYGIFLSLEDHVTGLIHISEISESFVRNVSDYVEMNEVIKAKVIEFDEKMNRLKLSIKDFDYKNDSKVHGIVETKTGFTKLQESLENWIDTKESEMARENEKK